MDIPSILKSVEDDDQVSLSYIVQYNPKRIVSKDSSTSIFSTEFTIGDVSFTVLSKSGESKLYKEQLFAFSPEDLTNSTMESCYLKFQLPNFKVVAVNVYRETRYIILELPKDQVIVKKSFRVSNNHNEFTISINEGIVGCISYIYKLTYPVSYSLIIDNQTSLK